MASRRLSVGNFIGVLLAGCAIMFLTVPVTDADDTFQCCLAGWKSVRGVVICNRPCCEGYSTRHAVLPALGQVTYCSKEPMAPSDSSSSFAMIPPNVMASNRGQPRPRRVLPLPNESERPPQQERDQFQSTYPKKPSPCQCPYTTS